MFRKIHRWPALNSADMNDLLKSDDIVFVYGALRSGTTVFRLMLDSHPLLANPGEMDFLFDHLVEDNAAPGGWRYNLDQLQMSRIFRATKLQIDPEAQGLEQLGGFLNQLRDRAEDQVLMINLHRHVDRLFSVFPGVKVIHMLRDPRDVARSSIAMGWAGTLYHGVDHWIDTELTWDRASTKLEDGQIYTLTYEGLFNDTKASLKGCCAFIGVPYTDDMLSYHKTSTYTPPDKSLTEQWRRKCDPRHVAELETKAAALMQARGYALSVDQPLKISTYRAGRLWAQNKLDTWAFGIRRFGFVTYMAEKLTRWAGLKSTHRRIKLHMDEIVVQNLK